MGINPDKVRKTARTVALVYAIPGLLVLPFMLAFANRPWPLIDYLIAGLGALYIIGLFIGLKWQGIGGLLSLLLPVFEIIHVIIQQSEGGISEFYLYALPSFVMFLTLMIPGIFYLISWNAMRKKGYPI